MADKIALTLHLDPDAAACIADMLELYQEAEHAEFIELLAGELRVAAEAEQTEWHGFVTSEATCGRYNGLNTEQFDVLGANLEDCLDERLPKSS